MPFWWRRRRKPWFGRWRKRFTYRQKRRRKYTRRRRPRRFARRRRKRRRRYKVRRKKQTINIKQWQPDSIKKCKIKGQGFLVAGAQGSQAKCYTQQKELYTQPKAPGGGGFGCEKFTLEFLYKEWQAHRNIWTASNDYKDLCRYQGCTFTFYRHADIDFIINYDRQPPFDIKKDTYYNIHPQSMLLARHKRILLSAKTNPKGPQKIKINVKPPKQMITKWFFQEEFCTYDLVKLQACATQIPYSLYGPNTQSPCLTIYALNTKFFQRHNWAQHLNQAYVPYFNYPVTDQPCFIDINKRRFQPTLTNYQTSVAKDTGFFNPGVLTAVDVQNKSSHFAERPLALGRYNPEEDRGVGNKVWFTTVLSDSNWAPPSDLDLIIVEEPLYIAFFGFADWITKAKGKVGYLEQGMFVVQSPYIKVLTPTTQKAWPIVDYSFVQGKMPWDETLTDSDKNFWYPTYKKQQQAINAIIESGPYSPKLANLKSSTWQLPYKYTFRFKWGGPNITDHTVQDPKGQEVYPVPDKLFERIQIADPEKQRYQAMLRPWDYRRGHITPKALKRMSENLISDESVLSDTEETPKKKKKITSQLQYKNQEQEEIQSCLLSLFEEDTLQESDNLKQLIQQQQQQQRKLKHNLIKLLTHMKQKQRLLQLHTGID
nr:MAG: ORF1 [Torque teno midi virus]